MAQRPPRLSQNGSAAGTRQLIKPPLMPRPRRCPAGTRLTLLRRWITYDNDICSSGFKHFTLFLVPRRLLAIHQHTLRWTADGMKPQAVQKEARPQEPRPVPACGIQLQATHLLEPPHPGGIPQAMPHQDTVEPQEVCVRTAGMKPPRPSGRPRDMEVAGLKHLAQIGEMNLLKRLRLQVQVRGSLGGMRPLPVRWDLQRHCWPQEKLRSEHRLWTWLHQHQVQYSSTFIHVSPPFFTFSVYWWTHCLSKILYTIPLVISCTLI